jgi:monoamine oxidase
MSNLKFQIKSLMTYDIIIIGAGAAGLMAAKELSAAGYTVCLLEADTKAGGRMATTYIPGFDQPVETGAEFVHGNLPLTLQLLNEANTPYHPVGGEMINVQNGKWHSNEAHDEHWGIFMQKLNQLQLDMTISAFLDGYFAEPEYALLRNGVQGFAEGFDLADITKASILAVREEWQHEEEEQYRIEGGYIRLTNYLHDTCVKQKVNIYFNQEINKVDYTGGNLRVYSTDGNVYEGKILIVTVSAGILQSGNIIFTPALAAHQGAIEQLGFGTVIKYLLQFNSAFWDRYGDDTGFLLSNEAVPTWWTQKPSESNILTGWLGGPKAQEKSTFAKADLLEEAISSLSHIFNSPPETLRNQLLQYQIICWSNHSLTKGGYSYYTMQSVQAKKVLSTPINDILFFAGEAIYDGESQGTVEAALQSGKATAGKVKDMLLGKH